MRKMKEKGQRVERMTRKVRVGEHTRKAEMVTVGGFKKLHPHRVVVKPFKRSVKNATVRGHLMKSPRMRDR